MPEINKTFFPIKQKAGSYLPVFGHFLPTLEGCNFWLKKDMKNLYHLCVSRRKDLFFFRVKAYLVRVAYSNYLLSMIFSYNFKWLWWFGEMVAKLLSHVLSDSPKLEPVTVSMLQNWSFLDKNFYSFSFLLALLKGFCVWWLFSPFLGIIPGNFNRTLSKQFL